MAQQSNNPCESFPNDESLLTALKRRIDRAMSCLYSRHQPKIVTSLARRGNNWQDAEDAFQEGVIAFWKNIDNIHLGAMLNTILHGYVHKKWVDIRRKKGRETSWPDDLPFKSPEPDPRDPYLDPDMQEELLVAMGKLTPESRQLMHLLIVEQMKAQEVADILELNIDSVYNQKSRCVKYLRKLLKR